MFIIEGHTVHKHCENPADARAVKDDVQSVDGSKLELSGEFIYAIVTDPDAACAELEEAGYDVEMR